MLRGPVLVFCQKGLDKHIGETSKLPKSWFFETSILKLAAVCPLNIHNFNFNGHLSLDRLYINRKTYFNLPNSAFWGWLSMESKPQNPGFRNNPESFHPCKQCRPRSDWFWRCGPIRAFPVCYSDKQPGKTTFFLKTEREKCSKIQIISCTIILPYLFGMLYLEINPKKSGLW